MNIKEHSHRQTMKLCYVFILLCLLALDSNSIPNAKAQGPVMETPTATPSLALEDGNTSTELSKASPSDCDSIRRDTEPKCGLPGPFNKLSPKNESINQSTSPALTWSASSGASRYEYCYDATNNNVCSPWLSNGTSTSKVLSDLNTGMTYYWHVRAINANGITYSNASSTAYWSFKTILNASFYNITGNAGVAGASLSYMDGGPKSVMADGSGDYFITVPSGWTGTVTPNKVGYQFTPVNRTYSNLQSNQTAQDYTAQGDKDTIGVFRPSNGDMYLRNSNTNGFADIHINYGLGGDYPVVGDWDGNGTDTIGVYRNGIFLLRNSNTLGFADITVAFGLPGDQPVAGDWNGDGIETIGVYRSSTGTFLLRNSNTPGAPDLSFALGIVGDVGIAGDWDGDGIATIGVFRPNSGAIFLKNTNAPGFADVSLSYGLPGDQPVVGDWDNNGTTTIGIYRNARFYLRNSNTNGFANIIVDLGIAGDMPIGGNWDGVP